MLKNSVKIMWNNNDITQDLEAYLIAVTYQDKISGESDVIEFTLKDSKHKFLGEWFPRRGSSVSISIDDLDFGTFEVDEINPSSPPSVIRIKANSISQNSGLNQTDESKSWEKVLLSRIAKDIADASGVELFYETDYDPEINRAEQGEQSRLAFLQNLCEDHGLIIKVADNVLIIFEEKSLEDMPAKVSLTWTDITHFDARATLTEVYKDCQVNYREGQQDKNFSATATDPTKTEGRTLKINKRVSSQAEAERLARHKLREKNKEEFSVTLTLPLNLKLLAGVTFQLEGFGAFDSKWIIDESSHTISDSGSVTRIKAHRCS